MCSYIANWSNTVTYKIKNLNNLEKLFILLAISSIFVKVLISMLGGNADLESWQIVGDVISQGKTIYDNTARYNYGPLWGYICGVVALYVKARGAVNVYVESFHYIIAFILAVADVAMAVLIYKMYSKTAGLLYLINPVSAVLTGSHSQFDNLAIMVGLLGWYFYIKGNKNTSYVVLGISMMFKHILLFFPIWLAIIELVKKNTWREKLIELLRISIIYLIFASGFAFEILRDWDDRAGLIEGLIKYVIMYRGYGASLGSVVTNLVVPTSIFNLSLGFPILKGNMFFYMLSTVAVGLVCIMRKVDAKYIFPIYILAFFAFSFSEARQYFAIPLVAVFIFYDRIESLIYTFLATIYVSTNAFSGLNQIFKADTYLHLFGRDFLFFPWTHNFVLTYTNVQVWVLILLLGTLIVQATKYLRKVALPIYITGFFISYMILSLYSVSVFFPNKESKLRVIYEDSRFVRFTCDRSDNDIYRVYEIDKTTAIVPKALTDYVVCPYKMPTW